MHKFYLLTQKGLPRINEWNLLAQIEVATNSQILFAGANGLATNAQILFAGANGYPFYWYLICASVAMTGHKE